MWKRDTTHYAALAVGVAAAAIEGYSNIEYIHSVVGQYSDPGVFAAGITSVGAAVLLAFSIKSFKHLTTAGTTIGLGLLLTLMFTAAYTMSTTLDRTSYVRQQKLVKVAENDIKYQEMMRIYKAIAARTVTECGAGVGERCRNNKAGLVATENDMNKRITELDSMGMQVQWMLSLVGIKLDVETSGKIAPMFLPVALFLLGMFCIAYGERGYWIPDEKPEFDEDSVVANSTAQKEKAIRFIREYASRNGRYPTPAVVKQVVKCNTYYARKYTVMAKKAA